MSINPFTQQAPIPGIKKIVVVGSGKGGVGKSTVAANLAIALKNEGQSVGLLDADIYGPSVPRIFGALNQPPAFGKDGKMDPIIRQGLKLMSIGFIVAESQAVVWRGPMLFKAIDQFLKDVIWGDLDYLIIDLPPGTGDIALTIAQRVPVSGAIIVCTPQNLALVDAKKAIDMFDQIHIPLLGVIENMAYFLPPGASEPIQLFPKGDIDRYLDAKKIVKLGVLPFEPQVGLTTEAGMPIVMSEPNSLVSKEFARIAQSLIKP